MEQNTNHEAGMENKVENTNHGQVHNTHKTSKTAVFIFITSILGIIGIIVGGVSFDSALNTIIRTVFGLVFVYIAHYAHKKAIEKKLNGAKLARFAFFAISAVVAIDLIGGLSLTGYAKSLRTFATTATPTFFANNLSALKENSTPELQKVLAYEDEAQKIADNFAEAGEVKECAQEQWDVNSVNFAPYLDFKNLKIGLFGNYSVRCYGENKPFDFVALTKYTEGKWLVDDYLYNTEISKDADIQNAKFYPAE